MTLDKICEKAIAINGSKGLIEMETKTYICNLMIGMQRCMNPFEYKQCDRYRKYPENFIGEVYCNE